MPKIEIERERELPSSFKNRTIGLRGGGSMGRGGDLPPLTLLKCLILVMRSQRV